LELAAKARERPTAAKQPTTSFEVYQSAGPTGSNNTTSGDDVSTGYSVAKGNK